MNFFDIFMKGPHVTKGVGTLISANGSNENFND
jgi:hypothetical protein